MNALINILNGDISKEIEEDFKTVFDNTKIMLLTDFAELDIQLQSNPYEVLALDQSIIKDLVQLKEFLDEYTSIEVLVYFTDKNVSFKHEKLMIFSRISEYKEWAGNSLSKLKGKGLTKEKRNDEKVLNYPDETDVQSIRKKEDPLLQSPKKTASEGRINESISSEKSKVPKNKIVNVWDHSLDRAKKLKSQLDIPFFKSKLPQTKSIGVWSPARNGVSTFIQNFAIFLSWLHIPVAVLEGISNKARLEETMSRYVAKDMKNWESFSSYLVNPNILPESVHLEYENVKWFPFGLQDHVKDWSPSQIDLYMNTLRFHDVLFVDFPTGEMDEHTLHSIDHVDELWIVGTDCVSDILEFKDFIHNELMNNRNITCKLLFNQVGESSAPKELGMSMNLQVVGCGLHYFSHEEVYLNNRDNTPIIFNQKSMNLFYDNFHELAQECIGKQLWSRNSEQPSIIKNLVNVLFPEKRSKQFHQKRVASLYKNTK
ncbi:hypothetical protein [Bacillus sp. SM2101]|uniref:hypothetical protein n=1 Tax=Bacillus sp. SM2101 TaxID=2805366 RepID=UPI001BDEAF4B|nr:hypothetical protein [Bacillus sp. SM2101]